MVTLLYPQAQLAQPFFSSPKSSVDYKCWVKFPVSILGPVLPLTASLEPQSLSSTHAFLSSSPPGREKGRCVASEYFLEPEINLVTENTENILSEGESGKGHRQQEGFGRKGRIR